MFDADQSVRRSYEGTESVLRSGPTGGGAVCVSSDYRLLVSLT